MTWWRRGTLEIGQRVGLKETIDLYALNDLASSAPFVVTLPCSSRFIIRTIDRASLDQEWGVASKCM